MPAESVSVNRNGSPSSWHATQHVLASVATIMVIKVVSIARHVSLRLHAKDLHLVLHVSMLC